MDDKKLEQAAFTALAVMEEAVKVTKDIQRSAEDALQRLPEAARRTFETVARETFAETAQKASEGLLEVSSTANEAAKRLSAVWLQQGVFLVAIAIVLMAGLYFGSKFLLASTMNDLATAREEVSELQKMVDKLSSKGGKAQISSCGDSRRLCIRIDSKAGNFGDNSEQYRVIFGY